MDSTDETFWSLPGYRVGKLIGLGGFSAVYEAIQESLDRKVAVKVLTTDMASESDRRRFDRERTALSRLGEHRYVVDVYDAGISPERRPYIVMRLYGRGTLAALLQRQGPLPLAQVVSLAQKVGSALEAAHAQGMIHRDVKPENVLLTDDGEPVLADFGITAIIDPFGDMPRARVSTSFFSLAHVAPEVLEHSKYSVASDVYALASTAYQLLKGQPAFDSNNPRVASLILDAPVPTIGRPDIPPEVDDVLARAMAKSPVERFQTAANFAEALAAVADGEISRSDGPTVPSKSPSVSVTLHEPLPVTTAIADVHDEYSATLDGLSKYDGGATLAPPVLPTAVGSPEAPLFTEQRQGNTRRGGILLGAAAVSILVAVVVGLVTWLGHQPTSPATALPDSGSSRSPAATSQAEAAVGSTRSLPSSPSAAPGPSTMPRRVGVAVAIPSLSGLVALPNHPSYVTVSPGGKQLYVASAVGKAVYVVDTEVNQLTATIPITAGPPQFLAFSPDGQYVYVSVWDREGGSIAVLSVIDTSDNTVKANIKMLSRPYLAAVSPDGSLVYVPNHDTAIVGVINAKSRTIVRQVPVPQDPHFIVLSRDGKLAYCADHESNVVSIIDTSIMKVIETIQVGKSPHSLALHPTQSLLVNVNYDSASVTAIDTTTHRVTRSIPVRPQPINIQWAPDGRFAYVVSQGDNTFTVINGAAMTVTATLPTGKRPTSIAVLPDGTRGYVSNSQDTTLTVINLTR